MTTQMHPEPVAKSPAWFKPKAFGIGYSPATWQGWLVTALFLAAAAPGPLLAAKLIHDPKIEALVDTVYLLMVLAPLIAVINRHSDQPWAWRWGRKAAK